MSERAWPWRSGSPPSRSSFGPALPGYAVLYDVLPLMTWIRGVARFGQLWLVAIAILAGFGWVRLTHALMRAAMPAVRKAALPLGVAVLVGVHAEALRVPIPLSEYQGIPAAWDKLRSTGNSAVLALFPFYPPQSVFLNARYMLYATRSFKPMLNGYSGFTPGSYRRHVEAMQTFPDRASIDYLRRVGVTHVVVEGHRMSGTSLAAIDGFPALQLAFTDGNLRIYVLRRSSSPAREDRSVADGS